MIRPRHKVYLVGAGPGDPELITLKAKRLLAQADVILYDHLASDDLLDLAPPGAQRIYVGKKRAHHSASQEEICAMLVEYSSQGVNVVRLKGGDPYLFGRGGEEAEALHLAGIPFQMLDVAVDQFDLVDGHAPCNTPVDSVWLVEGKVMAGLGAQ